MKLLMAMSKDGYLAKGPEDDMKWTGSVDKRLFWLLTQFSEEPTLIGRRSAELMPDLPGRHLVKLDSTNYTLDLAMARHENAVLIGGPTLAMKAIAKGMISTACIMVCSTELGSGMSAEYYLGKLFKMPYYSVSFKDGPEAKIYKAANW